MFLKDGKSILGNVGLVVSIAILVILLMFSYNKCMAVGTSVGAEGFADPLPVATTTTTIPNATTPNTQYPPPQNPRINISGSTLTLNFTVSPTAGTPTPIQFMVVLVQYDSLLNPTGNNRFYISNENIINPGSNATGGNNASINANIPVANTSLCQLINGSPACQYVFNNLDVVDTNGKPYYYKIGVSAVYGQGNSPFVLPYNVINSNGIFSLSSSLDAQNNQFSDYIKYRQTQTHASSRNYNSTVASPDGQYELIKAQLGGYPSNLVMDPNSAKQNTLADLVDKSMAQAMLNVNVNIPTTTNAAL